MSVYYYLRVALVMYRDQPSDPTPLNVPGSVALTLILALVLTLIIGVYPGPVANFTNAAAQSFFMLH